MKKLFSALATSVFAFGSFDIASGIESSCVARDIASGSGEPYFQVSCWDNCCETPGGKEEQGPSNSPYADFKCYYREHFKCAEGLGCFMISIYDVIMKAEDILDICI